MKRGVSEVDSAPVIKLEIGRYCVGPVTLPFTFT